MERKKKISPQNNSCYSCYILRFISFYINEVAALSILCLPAICCMLFFSYTDFFLSTSVSEITMDLIPLPECGLHKRINFNLWYFQICQTTELTTSESKVSPAFLLPSRPRGELGQFSQHSAQLWPRCTVQGCVEIWELLSHHVSPPKIG